MSAPVRDDAPVGPRAGGPGPDRTHRVDFGRPTRVVRGLGGRVSLRLDLRTLGVCGVLLLVALAVGIVALTTGASSRTGALTARSPSSDARAR